MLILIIKAPICKAHTMCQALCQDVSYLILPNLQNWPPVYYNYFPHFTDDVETQEGWVHTAAEWWSQESHPCVSISKSHAFKIFNQTILSDVPQASSGSATIATPTLDVRSAPMMCTSLPSFSGATLWMLSGDTTSESPSAREVAVFNARPCEQSRVRISKTQCGLI